MTTVTDSEKEGYSGAIVFNGTVFLLLGLLMLNSGVLLFAFIHILVCVSFNRKVVNTPNTNTIKIARSLWLFVSYSVPSFVEVIFNSFLGSYFVFWYLLTTFIVIALDTQYNTDVYEPVPEEDPFDLEDYEQV